ncbi:hypothetical protein BASA61_006200 [Batrachochytrium salamandrivorans]|nr:hypothetical protein BASA61_006200 [Batrachochytrium salamandrivorans]
MDNKDHSVGDSSNGHGDPQSDGSPSLQLIPKQPHLPPQTKLQYTTTTTTTTKDTTKHSTGSSHSSLSLEFYNTSDPLLWESVPFSVSFDPLSRLDVAQFITSWIHLPPEIKLAVASFLALDDIVILTRASRTLRQVGLELLLPYMNRISVQVHSFTRQCLQRALIRRLVSIDPVDLAIRHIQISFVNFPIPPKRVRVSWPLLLRSRSTQEGETQQPALSDESIISNIIQSSPKLTGLHLLNIPSSSLLSKFTSILSLESSQRDLFPHLVDLCFTLSPLRCPISLRAPRLKASQRQVLLEDSQSVYNSLTSLLSFHLPIFNSLQHLDITLHLTTMTESMVTPNYLCILLGLLDLRLPLKSLGLSMTGAPNPDAGTLRLLVEAMKRVFSHHFSLLNLKLHIHRRSTDDPILEWQRLFWKSMFELLADELQSLDELDLNIGSTDMVAFRKTLVNKHSLRRLHIAAGLNTVYSLLASYSLLGQSVVKKGFSACRNDMAIQPRKLQQLELVLYRSANIRTVLLPRIIYFSDGYLANVRHFTLALGNRVRIHPNDPLWKSFLGRLDSLSIFAEGSLLIHKQCWYSMAHMARLATNARRIVWKRSRKLLSVLVDNWSAESELGAMEFLRAILHNANRRQLVLDLIPFGVEAIRYLAKHRCGPTLQLLQLTATIPIVFRPREVLHELHKASQTKLTSGSELHVCILVGSEMHIRHDFFKYTLGVHSCETYSVESCDVAFLHMGTVLDTTPLLPPREVVYIQSDADIDALMERYM